MRGRRPPSPGRRSRREARSPPDPRDELLRGVRRSAPVGSFTTTLVAPRSGGLRARRACRSPPACRAVDETRVECPAGARDRGTGLAEIRDVVQRVVETEDVDAVLCRARHERPTMSPETGREPTRKRPRSAIPSGVETRPAIARMRSHGLSTRRRTSRRARLPGPPDTRSLRRRGSPRPAGPPRSAACPRGSCESRRIVVSTSFGTAGTYRGVVGGEVGAEM